MPIVNDFTSKDDKGEKVTDQHVFTHPETKKEVSRQVFNLVVFQDTDACTVRKVRVPHKDDAVEGENYFE